MKRKWAKFLKILISIPLLFVVLYALLQTPMGKALLAKSISGALSTSSGMEVQVGRITGMIPVNIKLESLTFADGEGVWLEARQLHFNWAMRDLLDGVANVRTLGAGAIELLRFPTLEKRVKTEKEAARFELMEVRLGNLEVEQLVLGEEIAGVPLDYAVHSGRMLLLATGELSGQLNVSGDAEGLFEVSMPAYGAEDYGVSVTAELQELRKPDLGLQLAGKASAFIGADGITFMLKADADDLELNVDAHAVIQRNGWAVNFKRFEIDYLERPALALHGVVGTVEVNLKGELAEFDLGDLPFRATSNYTGLVSGRLAIGGALSAPEVTAGLDILDLRTTVAAVNEMPDLNLHIDMQLHDGRLSGRSSMTNTVSGGLKGQADGPCDFSLFPFRFKLDRNLFKASLKADATLALLNSLSIFNDENIQGNLKLDLAYDGQADKPFEGHVLISGGSYEHYRWGVVVYDIEAELDAVTGGLEIRKMTATDGQDGRITVRGGIGLWQPGMPLDLQVDIKQANLVRRDEADAVISGQLKLGALLLKPSVTGTLVVDRADILLDNMAPPPPQLLTDFDLHAIPEVDHAVPVSTNRACSIDIKIVMKDQIFITAALIDSIWGGELRIKDARGGMSISGVIRPKRGYVSFLGKKFRLLDNGRINLNGSVPPEASIDITSEYSRKDIDAQFRIIGKLNDPDYTLTSNPPLPEDEVLSYILFGQDTSSISSYQAIQIAAAARYLAGGGQGVGVLHKFRQILRIDTLEFQEAEGEDGKTSVAAGKYMTSDIYVEVNSATSEEEDEASISAEYEMTRHFSIETSTGPKMRPGIGVNWKNDY